MKAGNVLNFNDLKSATKTFNKNKPITIITEGLLRYLDSREKTIVAENIKKLLKIYGGVWLTPDIIYKRNLRPDFVANNKRVAKLTGINIEKNKFKSLTEARIFFKNLGFTIKSYNFMTMLSQLKSPKKINVTQKEVINTINKRVVFVMTLK